MVQKATAINPEQLVRVRDINIYIRQRSSPRCHSAKPVKPVAEINRSRGKNDQFQSVKSGFE